MRKYGQQLFNRRLGKPIANASFAVMYRQVRAIEKNGIKMMHTARPFSYYRKVFYQGQGAAKVLQSLNGKTVVDVGCGYTPFADDSMFQACHRAGVDFFAVDPLIGTNVEFGFKERMLARAMGSKGRFNPNSPGLTKAISAYAQELPFETESVDEILCSYLLFVWIEDEVTLAEIFSEFLRVLKPAGTVKLYPLYEWRLMRIANPKLIRTLDRFDVVQHFVHGGLDLRVTPSMLTQLTKL